MKLRYTRAALAELALIGEYVGARSVPGRNRVRDRIRAVVKLLTEHPFIGTQTDHPLIRRMTTLPYPYLVFYQVGDAEVIIHSIRHAAQRPMELLDLE